MRVESSFKHTSHILSTPLWKVIVIHWGILFHNTFIRLDFLVNRNLSELCVCSLRRFSVNGLSQRMPRTPNIIIYRKSEKIGFYLNSAVFVFEASSNK